MGLSVHQCAVCSTEFTSGYEGAVWCQCITVFCCWDCALTSYDEEFEYSDEDIDALYELGEVESCIYCRQEDAADEDLLEFLLEHFKLEREEAVKLYYKAEKDEC